MRKWLCLSLALLGCVLLGACGQKPQTAAERTAQALREAAADQTPQASDSRQAGQTALQEPEELEPLPRIQKAPYRSPIDFEALQRQNADIYAWLDIPGTQISEPLVQRAGEDSYYLKHDVDGNISAAGAIYTESTYNTATLDDPVTLIYGHQMYDGTMFSSLQSTYSSPEGLQALSELVLYQRSRELHYEIFAAVPFDDRHILYSCDFTDAAQFAAFFDEALHSRALDAVIAEGASVSPDDRIVILSTCYGGDYSKRFLVLAKLIQTLE